MASNNLKGASLGLLSMAIFATHDAVVKSLGGTLTAFQIVFFAALFVVTLFAEVIANDKPISIRALKRFVCEMFGPETRGLPAHVIEAIPEAQRLRLPMRAGQRSLNLSNAVAVAVFEAWRQHEYEGSLGHD